MAPIKSAIKIDHYDIVIKDFEEKYTKARFFSVSRLDAAQVTFNSMVGKVNLHISVNLSSNGMIEVYLTRLCDRRQLHFPICLGGKIRLLDSDRVSSVKARVSH